MRRAFLLFVFVLACGLLSGWGQSRGNVTATADPEVICLGESSQLHAEAVVSTIVDFETGDFSQAEFNNTASSYPWEITTTHPYEGTYCMKSTCEGVNNGDSYIQATVPVDGIMSFCVRVSSENTYDKFNFYIDNVLQGSSLSGQLAYKYLRFSVSAGTHTYKWQYKKDSSLNHYDDCVYVDNITMFKEYIPGEFETFSFDNHTFQGWTTIDANGDGYNWKIGTSVYSSISGHNSSADYVASESYIMGGYGAVSPDNYLVSPQLALGGTISFYARAYSYSYPDEHFGIAVSTTSNTNASAFTTIQEWTMTSLYSSAPWYEYEVDLSEYEGQMGYVAIRHFGCYDEFALLVDDITYEAPGTSPGGSNPDVTFQWSDGNSIVGTGPDITVTPAQTTTYTVSAYQDDDLVGTAQQTVAVYQDPELSITTNTGSSEICEGDTIVLYVTVGGSVDVRAGDILCTDGSLVRPTQWPCGKTAKGVVFYVDATGQHGWAVDLDYSVAPGTTNLTMKWSSQNQTISGLQTYSLWMDAISDLDGKSNTQKIRSFGTASNYPAAWSVDFDNGWYLPAIGQLNILYGEYFAVNSSLDIVGGVVMSSEELWSSSVSVTNSKAYMVRINNGFINAETKSFSKNVRAVIDF